MSAMKFRHTPPANYVPSDYSDLFENYFTYVQRLVRRAGVDPRQVEDVSMTLLATFIEKDALASYNPNYASENGTERQAAFSSFLSGFILLYVRHLRDRQQISRRREVVCMDTPITRGPGADFLMYQTWADVFSPPVEPDFNDLEHRDLISTVSRHLRTVPSRSTRRVSLEEFFLRVAEQVEETGKYSTSGLAAEFGVSENSIRKWMSDLRTEMRVALEEDS